MDKYYANLKLSLQSETEFQIQTRTSVATIFAAATVELWYDSRFIFAVVLSC